MCGHGYFWYELAQHAWCLMSKYFGLKSQIAFRKEGTKVKLSECKLLENKGPWRIRGFFRSHRFPYPRLSTQTGYVSANEFRLCRHGTLIWRRQLPVHQTWIWKSTGPKKASYSPRSFSEKKLYWFSTNVILIRKRFGLSVCPICLTIELPRHKQKTWAVHLSQVYYY